MVNYSSSFICTLERKYRECCMKKRVKNLANNISSLEVTCVAIGDVGQPLGWKDLKYCFRQIQLAF